MLLSCFAVLNTFSDVCMLYLVLCALLLQYGLSKREKHKHPVDSFERIGNLILLAKYIAYCTQARDESNKLSKQKKVIATSV